MSDNYTQKDIDILKQLYFKQPRSLYQHLFGSYYQLVNEIIPSSLEIENNYFYESVSNDALYLHGFKCNNIQIKPPINPTTGELLSPMEARKKHLKNILEQLLPMLFKLLKKKILLLVKLQLTKLVIKLNGLRLVVFQL